MLLKISDASTVFSKSKPQIIIDAGHGLPDGGAIASDGTIEADINLQISKYLYEYLTDAGFECILTRANENSIYKTGDTIHAKKVSDIRERVKIANNNPSALVVSVHANTFPDKKVHGTQIFFKSSLGISEKIAKELQKTINENYQPDVDKTTKKISKNIYLFNHIENESILIETGFLTNDSDLAKLKDNKFNRDFSKTIAEVITYKLTGGESNGE